MEGTAGLSSEVLTLKKKAPVSGCSVCVMGVLTDLQGFQVSRGVQHTCLFFGCKLAWKFVDISSALRPRHLVQEGGGVVPHPSQRRDQTTLAHELLDACAAPGPEALCGGDASPALLHRGGAASCPHRSWYILAPCNGPGRHLRRSCLAPCSSSVPVVARTLRPISSRRLAPARSACVWERPPWGPECVTLRPL